MLATWAGASFDSMACLTRPCIVAEEGKFPFIAPSACQEEGEHIPITCGVGIGISQR